MAVALVLSLAASYQFKELFISLIIPLIAINLVVNPILLNQYLKQSSITKNTWKVNFMDPMQIKKDSLFKYLNSTALCLAFIFYQQINLVCDYMNKKRDNSQTKKTSYEIS